eukprot:TRINITY_DN33264_c0_g1_i2.p2 TRINITY_DN33264_c0_g1~~TRINITY_DN33264_c0_g1_i2.p2  ORF type:complete len:228 (+),score=95.04 TRINITY_DN33264_c0_g1_i2:79-762(+)
MAPKKSNKPAAKKAAEPKAEKKAPAAAAPAKASGSGKGVYVKGLSYDGMSHTSIKAHFRDCGEIKEIRMRGKKYCLIFFENDNGANKAQQLNGSTMKGNKITVEAATRAKPSPNRAETSRTVFVGNLPRMNRKSGKNALKKEFQKYGTVVKVRSYQAGHGFVYFKDNASAKKAVSGADGQALSAPFPSKRKVSVRYSIRTKELDQKKHQARLDRIAFLKAAKKAKAL